MKNKFPSYSFLGKWFPLFLISFLSLYLEIAVIRWLGSEIRLLAYFKNLILLASFMGLAIGFSLVGKQKEARFFFPVLWGIFVVLVVAFSWVSQSRPIFFPGGGDEFLWNVADFNFWLSLVLFIASILVFFLLSMFIFIPLGQAVGEEMTHFSPIPAYIINIVASICGVWAFSLTSFLGTPPIIWFSLSLLGLSVYYFYLHRLTPVTIGIFLLTLAALPLFGRGARWSPYNRLDLTEISYIRQGDGQKIQLGFLLDVQQTFHQAALDLSPERIKSLIQDGEIERADTIKQTALAYGLPYRLVDPNSRVLIVGTGMGNDVASALRASMGSIDAIEIDPGILSLGKRLHPEKPYDNPDVHLINNDARSFFSITNEKYDLVVFALLDSHTLLSAMSSVRLDSYVYTVESLALVRKLLPENGVVSITFATNEWIEERLGRMLAQVFGTQNLYYTHGILGTTFVVGPVSPQTLAVEGLTAWQPAPAYDNLPLTTDDWPYLYLRSHTIPSGYIQTLLVIVLVCFVIIYRSFPEALNPDWHFWLLGAAFMLIEFKSITELALLFGTTWFVNSLAITGVLLMALGANLIVLRSKRINLSLTYVLLFVSLILGLVIPLDTFAALPAILKALSSMLLLSLPLLFAGMIFSESLRQAGETARPLASNFSGSAAGGLLEYSSLLWGIKSLYWIAIFLYLGAFLVARLRRLL